MAFTRIKDVDLKILSELDDRSLLRACSTDKYVYGICNNEMFWKNRFVSKYGEIAAKYKPKERSWKNHYMQVVIDLDRFSKNPWEFLSHIQWSPKGAKYSYFLTEIGTPPTPFLFAPEWVMNNFYLLQIPNFEFDGVRYSSITPAKLFEILSEDVTQGSLVNGYGIFMNKIIYFTISKCPFALADLKDASPFA